MFRHHRSSLLKPCLYAFTLLLNIFCFAAELPTYRSGAELRKEFKTLVKRERGFLVSVPVDYNRPDGERTKIYAAIPHKFDARRPTVLFFQGGPGGPIHGIKETTQWLYSSGHNVVVFDQRGVAFSRPDTEAQYRAPDFYGSDKTARDADEIRRALNLDRWAIFGHSYGTVPATIYGHLFAERSIAVVLASTVDGVSSWTIHRRRILDHAYRDPTISALGRLSTKAPNGAHERRNFDRNLDWHLRYFGRGNMSYFYEFWRNRLKELGSVDPSGTGATDSNVAQWSLMTAFARDQEVIDWRPAIYGLDENVLELVSGLEGIRSQDQSNCTQTYDSGAYSLTVPVSYIHGTADPRTIATEGVRHYKSVPKARAQMILIKGGGHRLPIPEVLNVYVHRPEPNSLGMKPSILQTLLQGEMLLGVPNDCAHLLVARRNCR